MIPAVQDLDDSIIISGILIMDYSLSLYTSILGVASSWPELAYAWVLSALLVDDQDQP